MTTKARNQAGLGFGFIMAIVFTTQNLFDVQEFTTETVLKAVSIGLVSGALSGLLFGWLMGKFANSKKVDDATKMELAPGENILFQTPANHFKGMEGVGGKLYLTNHRLFFKSHKLNIQNHQLSIPVANIENVARRKTLGLVKNGLTVTTKDGRIEKFVVEQLEEWMKRLMNSY